MTKVLYKVTDRFNEVKYYGTLREAKMATVNDGTYKVVYVEEGQTMPAVATIEE